MIFQRFAASVAVCAVLTLSVFGIALGAEIRVLNSGGFTAAFRELAPEFERSSGHHLTTTWGASMGTASDAIPVRLKKGEHADVLIMVGTSLDQLIQDGTVVCDIRVDLAGSGIGMVVRKGAPKPDISTVDAFRRTLLAAKSIAYSDSASGEYVSNVLFQRLGIEENVKGKSRMIEGMVGHVIAGGEAELGFQQVSELLPVPGIDLVGSLPREIQKITMFSSCANAKATDRGAAKALVKYLSSPAAAPVIVKSGMEPVR